METLPSKKEQTRLDVLQEKIHEAAPRIEAEFARTANSWLDCFGSSVFVIETYLSSPKLQLLLSIEQYQRALKRVEGLKEELHELRQRYPVKETIPPTNIKEELLHKLDILRESD